MEWQWKKLLSNFQLNLSLLTSLSLKSDRSWFSNFSILSLFLILSDLLFQTQRLKVFSHFFHIGYTPRQGAFHYLYFVCSWVCFKVISLVCFQICFKQQQNLSFEGPRLKAERWKMRTRAHVTWPFFSQFATYVNKQTKNGKGKVL